MNQNNSVSPPPSVAQADEIVACIHGIAPERDFWRVRCWDGTRILEVLPPDPHAPGWPSHNDAYDALFAAFPRAILVGPDGWIIERASSCAQTGRAR